MEKKIFGSYRVHEEKKIKTLVADYADRGRF